MKFLLLLLLALLPIVMWLHFCTSGPWSFGLRIYLAVCLCAWQQNSSSSVLCFAGHKTASCCFARVNLVRLMFTSIILLLHRSVHVFMVFALPTQICFPSLQTFFGVSVAKGNQDVLTSGCLGMEEKLGNKDLKVDTILTCLFCFPAVSILGFSVQHMRLSCVPFHVFCVDCIG